MELPHPNLEQIQVLESTVVILVKQNDKNLSQIRSPNLKQNDKNLSQIRSLNTDLCNVKNALEEKTDRLSKLQLLVKKMETSQRENWALHLLFSLNEALALALILYLVLTKGGGELEYSKAFILLIHVSVKEFWTVNRRPIVMVLPLYG